MTSLFLDLDVPVESERILRLRSRLVYDQFCHFFYDIEDIKWRFKDYSDRFKTISVDVNEAGEDLAAMERILDEVPESMRAVEVIYDAILAQVSPEYGSHKRPLKMMSGKPFRLEIFGMDFFDVNDKWIEAYHENPTFYGMQIEELQAAQRLWEGVEGISTQQRQLLNFFMEKLCKKLESFEYFEFFIYALELRRMEKPCQSVVEKFHECRSVSITKRNFSLNTSTSDNHFEYRNRSRIPEDISVLVDETAAFREQLLNRNFFCYLVVIFCHAPASGASV
jgi:hypothetical protein